MNIDASVPAGHPLWALQEKLNALEQGLLGVDPQMPGHLKAIHKQMVTYPELAHVLLQSPEDVSILMRAQQKYVGISLVAEKVKKAATGKAKVSVNDLF